MVSGGTPSQDRVVRNPKGRTTGSPNRMFRQERLQVIKKILERSPEAVDILFGIATNPDTSNTEKISAITQLFNVAFPKNIHATLDVDLNAKVEMSQAPTLEELQRMDAQALTELRNRIMSQERGETGAGSE